jgi:cytochrome c peroxidase
MGYRTRIGRSAALIVTSWALLSGAVEALTPPPAYVLATDGTTQLTLEQAGILNADGRQWAIALGKALFWDQQAGSDGNACASCHFNAGADTRLTNQLNPGLKDFTKGPNGDAAFGSERSDTGDVAPGHMPSGAVAGPNYKLTAADLPMHKLQDEANRNSLIITTTNDRISSQGAFAGTFKTVLPAGLPDKCSKTSGTIFRAGTLATRQVEPRNTPTTVNSAFFDRTFLDGRANNRFNGVGVFGMRDILGDPNKRLIVLDANYVPQLDYLRVENASLASQAVGPPLSELEMSCLGRTFADVGRKMLFTIPLLPQQVAKTDSVLGGYASASGRGLALKHVYAALIMKAFDKKYWGAPGRYAIANGQLSKSATGYAQIEQNFSMFWGIAIMLYEQSLVSDQSDLDTLTASGNLVATPRFVPAELVPPGVPVGGCRAPNGNVDPLLVRGCTIFFRFTVLGDTGRFGPKPADGIRGGNCFVCHNAQGGGAFGPPGPPPMLSEATFRAGEQFTPLLRVGSQVPGLNHTHDQGFMSIGLRPPFTDLLNGGTDPYGNPLSYSRQYWNYIYNGTPVLDPVLQRAIDAGTAQALGVPPGPASSFDPADPNRFSLLGVDGANKAPILRNVALTPPYFNWGGYPTLRQVLKVYNRGGNRRDISGNPLERPSGTLCTSGDNSGTGPQGNEDMSQMATETNCSSNTTGVIVPLGLVDCELQDCGPSGLNNGLTPETDDLAALVLFLKSLTDRRVQCDQAPFDHPQLTILNGHKSTDANHDGKADDITFSLPAVGAAGYATTSGLCVPNSGDLFAPGMQARSGGAKVPL